VCGCDGRTHGNPCEANRAGTSALHDGECLRACGTRGTDPCPTFTYCDFEPASCGAADEAGVCRPTPWECPIGAPCLQICGCDRRRYCNSCEAARLGVDVAPEEFCSGSADGGTQDGGAGRACGGFIGAICPTGFYCDFPDDSCGFADASGTCEPVPLACPDVEMPVCGCDARRYSNACFAHAAGTDVLGGVECP
jgi:hypothetical protein